MHPSGLDPAEAVPAAYRVGDEVEITTDLSARHRQLRRGARGIVEVAGLAWGACTVAVGHGPATRRFMLAPRHLKLVDRPRPPEMA